MISKKYPASEFIKMAMEEKEWSAKDLSERSNINLKTISLLLNNKTPFTVKMDYLIGPALGFSVGILSSIEAQYLEWKNLQEDNININNLNYFFRKHKNLNEEKLKKTIIKAEKKVKEFASNEDDFDFNNYFYNEYLYEIQKIKDNLTFNNFLKKISETKKINLFLFNGVNIRGMSKSNNSNLYIFINKLLNKTIDSFIITLTHELLHHIKLNTNEIEFKRKNELEEDEKKIDFVALNLMLNDQLDLIKDNDLYNVELENIKQYSENLNLNWIYLLGLKSYMNKTFNEKNNINEIQINYEDNIWINKNI